MSEISERFRTRAERFAATIAAVPEDAWDHPSPCEGWTAVDVVRHVADGCAMFEGLVGRQQDTRPSAEDDPAGSFDIAWRQVHGDLVDPQRAAEQFDGLFGPTTFEESVDRFLSFDLIAHRWDLAKATGGDLQIPAEDVAVAFAAARDFGDAARSPQVFGPELSAPKGADLQTQFLAFIGRRGVVSVAEALRTTGAARTFTDRPVAPEVMVELLDDARFAPSGGNRQPWRVCWVRDRARLAQVAELIRPVADEYAARRASGIAPFSLHSIAPAGNVPPSPNAMIDGLPSAPALLIVAADLTRIAVMDGDYDRPAITGGASVYPFCWNLLLAARLRGLGGVLTTFIARVPAAAELLRLPDDHAIAAMIVLGYPEHQPTRLTRRPVETFATIDTFDGAALTT